MKKKIFILFLKCSLENVAMQEKNHRGHNNINNKLYEMRARMLIFPLFLFGKEISAFRIAKNVSIQEIEIILNVYNTSKKMHKNEQKGSYLLCEPSMREKIQHRDYRVKRYFFFKL